MSSQATSRGRTLPPAGIPDPATPANLRRNAPLVPTDTTAGRSLAAVIAILTFLAALFTTVATVIATVLFIIMQNAITSVEQLNIEGHIGTQMFAFMWIAAASAILAWLITLGQCCCCASRRDVKRGKKTGSKKAWGPEGAPVSEKSEKKKGWFGKRKN